jgi:hypothetical protein
MGVAMREVISVEAEQSRLAGRPHVFAPAG